jgi:peptidoglycan/LPS O-acetylase OafA/YrhL
MKRIPQLVVEHKRHIIGALLLSAAIFVALMFVNMLGIGGVNHSALQLGIGLIVAEFGRSIMCFGQKLKRQRLEYGGVFVQGLAWWIWSASFEPGSEVPFWLHYLVPALMIGILPVVVHHAGKHMMAAWIEQEEEGKTAEKS